MRIDWNATGGQAVAQCVRTILATEPGTVPMMRNLGVPQDIIDTPQSIAGARLQSAVVQALRTYEPRVKVKRVQLAADADGRLGATAEIAPNV